MPTPPSEPRLRTLLSTIPVLLLLLAVLLHGTGEKIHARLLQLGQRGWPGYAQLRRDPVPPACDPAGPGPAAKRPAKHDVIDDLLGEEDDSGEAAQQAAAAARKKCVEAHAAYQRARARITPGLRAFRRLETGVAAIVDLGVTYLQHLLVLLLLISAVTTTAIRTHIALRSPRTRLDHRVAEGVQLGANLLLLASSIAQWRIDRAAGIAIQNPSLPLIWIAGFAALAIVNLRNFLRPPAHSAPGGGPGRALLCVPLYATMAVIAGTYFLVREGHPSGLAIYLQKLTEHALLYLQVGLYVWIGMLLKRTRIAALAFDVLRPWRLPAEVLAALVVALAAFPTAYSGASGIFVMAAGGIIYFELRRAGARPQLATAATAMSGALGVVLRPCLLVVIVASLNKQVTTDQIYGWGWKIYLLTAGVLVIASLLYRRRPLTIAPAGAAARASVRGLLPLLPYAAVGAAVLAFYAFGLGTRVDEHTAPTVLPVLLLLLLVYDRRAARREAPAGPGAAAASGYTHVVREASSETAGHIGALLMLMGLSVCLGGIVERSGCMALVPQSLGSPVLAMLVLVVVMVLVGMTMDPYGAVILVSVTLAEVAYRNGIDPLHFWVMVLAAFELGYLTPPVALNNLLVRRIVEAEGEPGAAPGAAAAAPAAAAGLGPGAMHVDEPRSYWGRHEAVLLPVVVMSVRLLLVAFVPFLWR